MQFLWQIYQRITQKQLQLGKLRRVLIFVSFSFTSFMLAFTRLVFRLLLLLSLSLSLSGGILFSTAVSSRALQRVIVDVSAIE